MGPYKQKRPLPAFTLWQGVVKHKGDARYVGVIVSIYYTTANKLRYVIEVIPQHFQMIVSEPQIRPIRKSDVKKLPELGRGATEISKMAFERVRVHNSRRKRSASPGRRS